MSERIDLLKDSTYTQKMSELITAVENIQGGSGSPVAPSFAIGTVTQLAAGQKPTVELIKNGDVYTLNFGLPVSSTGGSTDEGTGGGDIDSNTSIIPQTSRFAGFKTSSDLVKAITVGWNLAGTLEAVGSSGLGTETSWGEPKATQQLFDAVKAKGFNAVRIPVTWSQHINWNDDNRTIDSAWMDRVKEVVNYALKDDMIVILNTHHDHSVYSASNFRQWLTLEVAQKDSTISNFKKIWTQIADTFKDFDGRLIFEGWNEIQHNKQDWVAASDEEWEVLNTLSQAFVDSVRATGGNNSYRCLLINPPMTSDKNMVSKMIMPNDPCENRLLISGHPYDARYDSELEDRFPEWDKMIAKGIPVIFGEVGTDASMDEDTREKAARNYAARSRQHGIPQFWWDDETRKLINRVTYEWAYDAVATALVEGATTANIEDTLYTAEYKLNSLDYWVTGNFDEKTGQSIDPVYNSKILKTPISVSEGHKYNITVKSHDNGFQCKRYVFYDKDDNYVYGITKASMYNISVVCPSKAAKLQIMVWNPWGARSDGLWTSYFNNETIDDVQTSLSIIIREEETDAEFEDERILIMNDLDTTKYECWRKGEYDKNGGYDKSLNYMCLNGLLPVAKKTFVTYTIEPGSLDTSDLGFTVRTYNNSCEMVENLWRVYQDSATFTGAATAIGLSIFSKSNLTGITQEDYKKLFDSGMKIHVENITNLNYLQYSGSELAAGKALENGKLADYGSSTQYRAFPCFDVSQAGRKIVFSSRELLFRFAEYDENLNVIATGPVKNRSIFNLNSNTKYFQVTANNLDSGTNMYVGYTGTMTETEINQDDIKVLDKTGLASAINAAKKYLNSVNISTDGEDLDVSKTWVTQADYDTFSNAISNAQSVYDNANSTYSNITDETNSLNGSVDTFKSKIKNGTKSISAETVDLTSIDKWKTGNNASNGTYDPGIAYRIASKDSYILKPGQTYTVYTDYKSSTSNNYSLYIIQIDSTGTPSGYNGVQNGKTITIKADTAKTMFTIANPNDKTLTFEDYEQAFADGTLAPKLIPVQ